MLNNMYFLILRLPFLELHKRNAKNTDSIEYYYTTNSKTILRNN